MGDYQQRILSESIIERIRCKISDFRTQNVSVYDPDGIESLRTLVALLHLLLLLQQCLVLTAIRSGTSYIATADNSGLAISGTTTINTYFASKVMVPETGVLMNNEMDGKKNS